MYDNETETQPVEQTREYAEHRNYDVQNGPGETPSTWLVEYVEKRVKPVVDTGESELYIHEPYSGDNEPNRYRLRLVHPDSSETDLSPALDAGEFEAFLFGLTHGLTGEIEHHAEGNARTCEACGEEITGTGPGDHCSTACALEDSDDSDEAAQ